MDFPWPFLNLPNLFQTKAEDFVNVLANDVGRILYPQLDPLLRKLTKEESSI